MKRQESKPVTIPLLHQFIPASLLATLTALIYYPSLHYAFQFDDIANINLHYNIRHGSIEKLFFSGTRWISYWLNSLHYQVGKFDPWSYRAFNVFLHATNGLLVFFIFLYGLSHLKKQSFFKDNALTLSFATALLFLLHPVQTQTVSYVIQGQLEGLAAFFITSMSLCLLLLGHAKHTTTQYFFALLLFILAILACGSKEITIISPALLLLIDWFFIAQGDWQSLKKRGGLHLLITTTVVSCFVWLLKPAFFTSILGLQRVAYNNIGNIITQSPKELITPWIFFISQFKVIIHYFWIFIWPFGISVEYDWVLSKGLFSADCLFPLAGLTIIAWFVTQLLKKNSAHIGAFGLVWFGACLAPRSSIIPSPELLVDYKTYTASMGWVFVLATGIVWIIKKAILYLQTRRPSLSIPSLTPMALSALLAIPLGLVTMQRNTVWRSGLEFWGNILQNAPGKARAYNNYGVELSQNFQNFKESIPYFKKAIEMDPLYPDPCNNIAVAYSNTGQLDLAIAALKRGLEISPYYPEGYNNLASFYLKKKDFENAEKNLRTALALRPHYGKAYFNLGRLYLEKGDQDTAWQYFKNCCTIADLDNEMGFTAYAQTSFSLKKFDAAINGYIKVLELNPRNCDALFNLANCYFFTENHDAAERWYKQLLAADPNNVHGHYNLGETYFVTNRPEKALAHFQTIIAHQRQLPQLCLRIAECHEKMGNVQISQKVLHEMLKEPLPTPLKVTAQNLLTHLEARYKLPTIST